jgi:hypothetical protein
LPIVPSRRPAFKVFDRCSRTLATGHDPGMTSSNERLARAVELRERGELEQARRLLLELRGDLPDDPHVAVQTAWVHDSMGLE